MTTQLKKCFFPALVLGLSLTCFAAVTNAQAEPSAEATQKARRDGPCRDPWVTIALQIAKAGIDPIAGVGDVGDCATQQYGGGQWSSFKELFGYVDQALTKERDQKVKWVKSALGNGNFQVDFRDTSTGENLWRIVAAGGGNVISNDGAGLIGQDGASMRALMSGSRRVIQLGKSVIIIRK